MTRDSEIIDIIQRGERNAVNGVLKQLYMEYYPLVEKLILNNSGNRTSAADIFQESLIVFYNRVKEGKFNGASGIKTYIYAIARNLWLIELRRNKKVHLNFEGVLENYKNLEVNKEELNRKKIRLVLDKLNASCKEVLLDFYFGGLDMGEIRLKYGLGSEQAAKNKKYRCLQNLIKMVKSNYNIGDFVK